MAANDTDTERIIVEADLHENNNNDDNNDNGDSNDTTGTARTTGGAVGGS
jgi:hypothetical protein